MHGDPWHWHPSFSGQALIPNVFVGRFQITHYRSWCPPQKGKKEPRASINSKQMGHSKWERMAIVIMLTGGGIAARAPAGDGRRAVQCALRQALQGRRMRHLVPPITFYSATTDDTGGRQGGTEGRRERCRMGHGPHISDSIPSLKDMRVSQRRNFGGDACYGQGPCSGFPTPSLFSG